MNDGIDATILKLLLGVMIGFFLAGVLSTLAPDSFYNQVNNAKKACEKNLPRSQNCVITAVPEKL